MSKRVLVLGGHGFLGSTVAHTFAGAGWQVVRSSRRRRGDDTVRVDLSRPDTVAAAIEGVDLVVNTVPDQRFVAEKLLLERGGI